MRADVVKARREIIKDLYPEGIPALWCPMIVHYTPEGKIDFSRMEKHLQYMLPDVRSFLLFGSTGDGWELTLPEKESLLVAYVKWARQYGVRMLLGVLKPGAEECCLEISNWLERIRELAQTQDTAQAMHMCGVAGFTVCAPAGAELSQQAIQSDLEKVLAMGLPTALYQLPQVTKNEIAPETLRMLAGKYPNLYLFKDTSGRDRAILSGLDFGGVFFVRGMEGDYFKWLAEEKTQYPGFLLSSANCFASLLKLMLESEQDWDGELAKECSGRVQGMIEEVFASVLVLKEGNVYANTNKCLEHCLAYGAQWEKAPMPMRHCGKAIPATHIALAAQVLEKYGCMPEKGYLKE